MIKVVLIGSGNVASHLIKAMQSAAGIELVQVFARNPKSLLHLLPKEKITADYSEIADADVYIIAVSDNAIAEVSAKLPFANRLVMHTSGSSEISVLDDKNRKAVFYPLQTFSKNKEVHFKEIPLCIETQNKADLNLVLEVAKNISNLVYEINSEQRKSLHVAAVFVCNFVNHLYHLGETICKEHQVPFEILKPLILETAKKIEILSPNDAQTGPAKRKDSITINKHLAFLKEENQKEIYKILTKSIIDNDKKL